MKKPATRGQKAKRAARKLVRDSAQTAVDTVRASRDGGRPAPSSEVSEQFIQGMRDRMAMSYFKYGPVADAYPEKVNALESLQARIKKYEDTGNTEWLMDAANYCMIEFMRPAHRRAHYKPTDTAESPGRAAYDTDFEGTHAANSSLTDAQWRELRGDKEGRG